MVVDFAKKDRNDCGEYFLLEHRVTYKSEDKNTQVDCNFCR